MNNNAADRRGKRWRNDERGKCGVLTHSQLSFSYFSHILTKLYKNTFQNDQKEHIIIICSSMGTMSVPHAIYANWTQLSNYFQIWPSNFPFITFYPIYLNNPPYQPNINYYYSFALKYFYIISWCDEASRCTSTIEGILILSRSKL